MGGSTVPPPPPQFTGASTVCFYHPSTLYDKKILLDLLIMNEDLITIFSMGAEASAILTRDYALTFLIYNLSMTSTNVIILPGVILSPVDLLVCSPHSEILSPFQNN